MPKVSAKMPMVSVIIATYNRADVLRAAIDSVLNQSYSDLELIVVDDASTDGTHALLSTIQDARLRCLRLPRNQGVAAARNSGITQASGRWLAFLDSDDCWHLGKLQFQMQQVSRWPDCGLFICGLQRGSYQFPPASLMVPASEYAQAIRHSAVAFTQTWLLRRELLTQCGPFDTRMQVWEDWDLLLRLSELTTVVQSDKILVNAAASADSLSAGPASRRIEALEIILARTLSEKPQQLRFAGRLSYLLGRFQLQQNCWRQAFAPVWRAVYFDPRNLRAWLLGMIVLTGPLAPQLWKHLLPGSALRAV